MREPEGVTSQLVLRQRSKVVTAFLMVRALLKMPLRSATEARLRDRAAEFGRCRLRRQVGAPTRVGPAALGTAKRRTEQPRVELVRRGSATPEAVVFKRHTVAGAATRTSALMHHTVIRQRHAGRTVAKLIVCLLPATGLVQTVLQYLNRPGIREGRLA